VYLVNAMEGLEAHLEMCIDSAWRADDDHRRSAGRFYGGGG
jgi:hypothetical protein